MLFSTHVISFSIKHSQWNLRFLRNSSHRICVYCSLINSHRIDSLYRTSHFSLWSFLKNIFIPPGQNRQKMGMISPTVKAEAPRLEICWGANHMKNECDSLHCLHDLFFYLISWHYLSAENTTILFSTHVISSPIKSLHHDLCFLRKLSHLIHAHCSLINSHYIDSSHHTVIFLYDFS